MKPTTHDEYLASIPEPARQLLKEIQACVEAEHPDALIAELTTWRGPKGNLSIPLDKPLPLALIGRVASALRLEYDAKI